MGRDLHASTSVLELVVPGYGVSSAFLLVLGGRLGDAFGRHRLYVAGMAGCTVSSLACGLAPSAWALVGGRILQGSGVLVTTQQVAIALGATVLGTLYARLLGPVGEAGAVALVVGVLACFAAVAAVAARSPLAATRQELPKNGRRGQRPSAAPGTSRCCCWPSPSTSSDMVSPGAR
jgi:MFS family permease